MQVFCCPPYGQPNGQQVGRPDSCTGACRAARGCCCSAYYIVLVRCFYWHKSIVLRDQQYPLLHDEPGGMAVLLLAAISISDLEKGTDRGLPAGQCHLMAGVPVQALDFCLFV